MRLKRHIDFINENDNLERSGKALSKFGMLPKEEILQRAKDLLDEHVFAPQSIDINKDGELNIYFWPGSSLKRDIKNAFKNDELINTYYNLSPIEFINWGDSHGYTLRLKKDQVEQEEEEVTPEMIANDLIQNADFREEDLYGEDILKWELDKYLPSSSYDVNEDDYDEIVKIIINKIGKEEDDEEDQEA